MEKLELLLKKIHHQLSDEERILVDKWIEKNDKNKLFFEMLKGLKGKGEDLKTLSEVDINKTWESVLNRHQEMTPPVIPFYKKPIFRYGIAASILILISLGYFLKPEKNTVSTPPEIVNHQISKGTNKATLTLENGTVVALEKGKLFTSDQAKSDGEKLIYQNKTSTITTAPVYNYLTIPRGGEFYLELEDQTKVWLNSASKLKYPVDFIPGQARKVELLYGEAYFEVSPSSAHEGAKFYVSSALQEIEVVGTAFNLKAYEDEDAIYTTLEEGVITLHIGDQNLTLSPMDQAILNKKSSTVEVKTVDAYDVSSWRNGVFSFKDMPLKNIMTVLSRWYDTDVIFENKSLEPLKFNGVLRKNQSIEEILSTINNLKTIAYEFDYKKVIIK